MTAQENPLLTLSPNLPFDITEAQHVGPAVTQLIAKAEAELHGIAAAPSSYETTLGVYDRATEALDFALGVASHLESTASTPEWRTAYAEIQEAVSTFYTSVSLSQPIYDALAAFAATPEAKGLSGGKKRLLEKTLQDFVKNGVNLPAAKKARLSAIDVELAQTTLRYSQNVLDATNAFEEYVPESDLAGLPPAIISALREDAEQKGQAGCRVTLQAPCYIPILTHAIDRNLRRRLYLANISRASVGTESNLGLARKILALRDEKAKILGFADFADLVISDKMAKSGDAADRFVADLRERILPAFERENRELEAYAVDIGAALPLEPWDVAFYAEKLRKQRFDFDDEALRPYFPLDRVSDGLFELASLLYGVHIRPWTANEPGGGPRPYNADVKSYVVADRGGGRIGAFYMDLFPRSDKRDGAWMGGMLDRLPGTNSERENIAVVVGNMTPPAKGARTALLTHRDVVTLFHEFGHLMHHVLSTVSVRSLSGTRVLADFVELPSMLMENFAWEDAALDRFARHVDTGEPLPQHLRERMRSARSYRAANMLMRQLGFSTVDLAMHRAFSGTTDDDLRTFARSAFQPFSGPTLPAEYAMVASFSHLFGSPYGYAAGYYAYQWSEVLEADAFSRFRKHGVLTPEVGAEFRHRVLARGDEAPPDELYRDFLGRDPSVAALVTRMGLA